MLSAVDPSIPDRGDRIRARHALEALARRFEVDLILVGARPTGDGLAALESLGVRIIAMPFRGWQRGLGVVRGITTNRPWGMLYSKRLARAVARSMCGQYEVALAFQLKTAPLVAQTRASISMLELTDSLGLYRSLLRGTPWDLRRLSLAGVEAEEGRWAARFDYCLVSSERDKVAVQEEGAPEARLVVVENGTRAWRFPVAPGPKANLLFVGNLYYPPNQSGLLSFLRNTWPNLRAKTGLSLRIAGQAPRRLERGLEGVEYLGYVNDLTPEYARALALVNPVEFGTGTRSKVLEAWAAGLPVISTKAGAMGLEFIDGVQLLLADSASEWTAAVMRLREEPLTWISMSHAGFLHAASRYDATHIWDTALEDIWRSWKGHGRNARGI